VRDFSPGSQESPDREWLLIQQGMQAASMMQTDVDPGLDEPIEDGIVRAITFNSPDARSIGASSRQQEELSLLRQSAELDDESSFIEDYKASMEGNFALVFAEVTLRRLNARRVQKRELDLYTMIDGLNLPDHPYAQWAARLEEAIVSAMRS
jgi:hypothetical protein